LAALIIAVSGRYATIDELVGCSGTPGEFKDSLEASTRALSQHFGHVTIHPNTDNAGFPTTIAASGNPAMSINDPFRLIVKSACKSGRELGAAEGCRSVKVTMSNGTTLVSRGKAVKEYFIDRSQAVKEYFLRSWPSG
jgi:hypothetical protein